MRRVMGLLKYVRDKYSLSIIATTHKSKGSDGGNYSARGASVIAVSVDQHILVKSYNNGEGFSFKVPKSRGGQRSPDSNVIKFVAGETSGSPSLRLEYTGEDNKYVEWQTHVFEIVRAGTMIRKDILAAL